MAPVGTLWGSTGRSPPESKIICSVAALNDLELIRPEWNWSNRQADFPSKFPYNKIPAFEAADGFKLIEGATIARYLSGLGTKINLLGSDPKEMAHVDQWIHFAEQEIGVPAYNIIRMIYGFFGPFDREALDKQLERLERALVYVETHLVGRQSGYVISDSVTLADLFVAGMVHCSCQFALGKEERAKYPFILAHYAKVTQNEKLKEFWDTNEFTEVAVREAKKFLGP